MRPLDLETDWCRKRQARLIEVLAKRECDAAILHRPEHIQYFTGWRSHRLHQAAVCLDTAGRCLLVAPQGADKPAAVTELVSYEAQPLATLRQSQERQVRDALENSLREFRRIGIEPATVAPARPPGPDLVEIDADLWRLRRHKDPDELALIRRAIGVSEAMYAEARATIRPGISELEVYSRLQAAAVAAAGEPLTACGNDFQCGTPGGLPRARAIERGELYILDLGPAYRGYYADNCRTFAVGNPPDSAQRIAWDRIVAVLEMVERTVRPGLSCRELYRQAKEMLDEWRPDSFFHHLGHGIGLDPHETPHLNPHWDDVFHEGDVFTAEPGLYAPELRGGIRLEEDYRVTATGVERLTAFPLEL